MKKYITLMMISFIVLMEASAAMNADVNVNSVHLSWDRLDGDVYYDLYLDGAPLVRLSKGETEYTVSHLDQLKDYTVILGVRDKAGNTLHAEKVSFTTGTYSGTYRFVNTTGDDNHGKLKTLEFRAQLMEGPDGQYMAISYPVDGTYIPFFPFEPYDGPWDWIKFKSDLPLAKVYKDICIRINKLDIMPSSFQIQGFTVTTDSSVLNIVSKAFGLKVPTNTEYLLRLDKRGNNADLRKSR